MRLCPRPSNASDIHHQFQGVGYGQKATTSKDDVDPRHQKNGARHLRVETIQQSKIYTDNTVRFPTRARSRSQYVMVVYHSSNAILVQPFKSRKDTHSLEAYNVIIQRLKDRDLLVDLQILDNECNK
jgi:hypothetical protein